MAKRDSRPYWTRQYRNAKRYLKENEVTCYVIDDDGPCWRRGTIPDHVPPLSTLSDPMLWSGVLLPMCAYHSNKQRGQVTQGRILPAPTRAWR